MSSRIWNIISLISLVITVIAGTLLYTKSQEETAISPKSAATPPYAPPPEKSAVSSVPEKTVTVLTAKQEKLLKKLWDGCNSLSATKRLTNCQRIISSGLENNDGLLLAYTNRASAYAEKEKYKLATQDYDFILKRDPNNFEALISRGDTYQILNRFDKSIIDYSAAIEINSKDYNAYLSRAWAYYQMDKVNAGLLDLDKAIKINKSNSELYATRGQFYETIGRNKEAAKNYRVALKLNKKLIEARDGLKRTSGNNVAARKKTEH